jgi:hypothetical protein
VRQFCLHSTSISSLTSRRIDTRHISIHSRQPCGQTAARYSEIEELCETLELRGESSGETGDLEPSETQGAEGPTKTL